MGIKAILIIGKDEDYEKDDREDLRFYEDDPDNLILDFSKELISSSDFREILQSYEIDKDTRIDIWAHGSNITNQEGILEHSLELLSDNQLTKDVLKILSKEADNEPLSFHIWSCSSGTSSESAKELPEGSIVFGHGPKNTIIKHDLAIASLIYSLENYMDSGFDIYDDIGNDLLDNLPSYTLQDLYIGIKGMDGSFHDIRLHEPSSILADSETITGKFAEYGDTITERIIELRNAGILSKDIIIPDKKHFSNEEIRQYEFKRNLYDIFSRKDNIGNERQGIDFSRIMDGTNLAIQTEESLKNLTTQEKALLNPKFQKKLVTDEDIKGDNYLIGYLKLNIETDINILNYFSYIAQKQGDLNNFINKKNNKGDSALIIAAECNQKNIVAGLISLGANIDIYNDKGETALSRAVIYNSDESIDILLSAGANVNCVNDAGASPLFFAIKNNKLETVEKLLNHGADVNLTPHDGISAFEYAIETCADREIISKIHEKTIEPNLSKNHLLRLSIIEGNLEEVSRLISEGINLNTIRQDSGIVIASTYSYLSQTDNVEIAKLLVENGSNNSLNQKLSTIVKCKNPEVAKFLYESLSDDEKTQFNADDIIECKNNEVASFLFTKISKEERNKISMEKLGNFVSKEVLNILISDGEILDYDFVSMAINNWSFEKTKILVEEAYTNLDTIMLEGIISNREDIVINALQAGANIEATTIGDRTRLMLAVNQNNANMVEILAQSGAKLNATDVGGNSALHLAIYTRNPHIAEILIKSGSDVNIQNAQNITPLFQSVSRGNLDMVTKLLESGADPDIPDNNGQTPLALALRDGKNKIAIALLNSGASVNKLGIENINPTDLINMVQTNNIPNSIRFPKSHNILREAVTKSSGSKPLPSGIIRPILNQTNRAR